MEISIYAVFGFMEKNVEDIELLLRFVSHRQN